MRHLLKTFVVLSIILMFSGCEKEPDLTLKQEQEDTFSTPFHENITETYVGIFQLISTGMREAITKPQLYFLTEVGDTRMDCPSSSVEPGTTYPKIMTLTFDNCSSAGINYNAVDPIEITFNAPLGEEAASGPEIEVEAVSGITINGYTFTSTGPITLDRNNDSTDDFFSYDFVLGGDITSTNNGTTTTLPAQSCGTFSTGLQDGDTINSLATFLDNPFDVSLKQTNVVCTASNGISQSFCTMTGEEPLSLNPANCSCPTQGDLEIIAGACGSSNGPISEYDFGSSINNSDDGICDTWVSEVTVLDFISWEGVIVADGGFADGLTSIDIMVDESNSTTPVGSSLQLTDGGTGAPSHGFLWTASTNASSGMINSGQTITNTTTPNTPWINEIHYDNISSDSDEGVEIAGPAGLDLSLYCLQAYDGADNQPIQSSRNPIPLSGTIPNEGNGYGTIWVPIRGLQNGDPGGDAIALYRKDNVPVGFCAGGR